MNQQNPALDKFKIENSTLFRGVAFDSVVDLLENMAVQEFKQGETILTVGQPNQMLYLVLSGNLNVYIKLTLDPVATLARIDHRFGNEGDFGRPERFSESFAIDPVQVE